MKKCSICGEIKPKELFFKHNTYKDGLFAHCKECTRKQQTLKKLRKKEIV